MKKDKLSQEEKELLEAVESGEYESKITESRRKELQTVANNSAQGRSKLRRFMKR